MSAGLPAYCEHAKPYWEDCKSCGRRVMSDARDYCACSASWMLDPKDHAAGCPYVRIVELEAENAKLREALRAALEGKANE